MAEGFGQCGRDWMVGNADADAAGIVAHCRRQRGSGRQDQRQAGIDRENNVKDAPFNERVEENLPSI